MEHHSVGDEWQNVEPEVFKFEKPGESLSGKLIKKEEENSKFGNLKAFIRTTYNQTYIIFCQTVLEQRLSLVDVGEEIMIVYEGEDKENAKQGNPLKVFSVYRKRIKVTEPDKENEPPF